MVFKSFEDCNRFFVSRSNVNFVFVFLLFVLLFCFLTSFSSRKSEEEIR